MKIIRRCQPERGGIILPLIALLLLIVFLGILAWIIIDSITRIVPREEPDPYIPPITWTPPPSDAEEPAIVAVFDVERTTDLTNWHTIATIRGTNGQALEWSDPDYNFYLTNNMGFWRTRFLGFETNTPTP